ncbi:MAG: asparagine--tRNA ligase [Bdellovibrionaceae bacterium]|nr:asparagine--tRNA ligase [Pseudobdellovibrionaceae bacterium]NUM57899.1 asparagine--tRNA ligase [Pseudobdellovibrionaceae bacterium]
MGKLFDRYTLVKSINLNHEKMLNQKICVSGWARKIRISKNFGFIELNDGSHFKGLQVVVDNTLTNFEEISHLSISSSLIVEGVLVKSEGAEQPYELKASHVNLIQKADLDYPLQNKRHTMEFLREIAHLRPRTNTFAAVFRVRSVLAQAIHEFFQTKDFVYVHTPIITGSDCEGAGEMFRVTTLDLKKPPKNEKGEIDFAQDFFCKETNLTVSGQLNVETYCAAFRNVYTFGPTFRAENSNTSRHAAEFWMIEPEMAFADLDVDMEIAEEMIKFIIQKVLERCPDEMAFFNQWVEKGLFQKLDIILKNDFVRCTYTEGIDILKNCSKNFEHKVEWGMDLQSEHERYLAEEHFKKPVFLTNYPKDIKAFYMKLNEDGKTVRAMDLLAPGIGEIIGGSQREDQLDLLEKRMLEMHLNPKDYKFYTDLRRYGSFPHAGFGLGFERMLMYITGVGNIRDVIPFPRTPRNADF